jgi:hypothetical protein
LKFGARAQKSAPHLAEDIAALTGKGIAVMIVAEDMALRGIKPDELVGSLQTVSQADLPKIFAKYDHVWHW